MQSIDLKALVSQSVRSEWPAFAERHPRLAAVLDETLVTEQAIASIADDPEYQQALATADEVGACAQVIADVVTRFVGTWLKNLI